MTFLLYIIISDFINTLKNETLNGGNITPAQAESLQFEDKDKLYKAAEEITRFYLKDNFDMCSIMNAKSGKCSEDCKWCAQSAHFKTKVDIYPIVEIKDAAYHAQYNENQQINRFSLVTSGKGLNKNEIKKVSEIYSYLNDNHNIKLCASLGLLDKEDLQILRNSGVSRYHCNLETAPSYFDQLCTTHTQEDKIQTINLAREVGMSICCGGIIGMGESMNQRIELAFELKRLDIQSIPINILSPIEGTPLENMKPLSEDEILTTIAIFRFINPKAYLRFAGGRNNISIQTQKKALKIGINSSIVGDLLTTIGSKVDQDKIMFEESGYKITI